MDVCVKLDRVSKRHGATVAVDQVSLDVQRGEFFSILGPSGSGKTTLLRLIAGLDVPDEGQIFIQNVLVNGHPPNKRPVNLVFQQYALFPHLTVFDNVAFGLKMRRESSSKIQTAVEKMLRVVKLSGKDRRFPGELSGGEQQRVALARALVNEPVVLLLDEPLAALDQQLRQNMHGELKRIQQELHATFICVTHQQDEALMLSDRLAVMSSGSVRQVGTPEEVYQRPNSLVVANFIGLSNTVSGILEQEEGENCVIKQEGLPVLKVPRPRVPMSSSEGIVMVRPERMVIGDGKKFNSDDNVVPGRVVNIVFHGNEIFYHVCVAPELVWVVRMSSAVQLSEQITVGQSVQIRWHIQDGILLPVDS